MRPEHRDADRRNWNERAPVHAASADYGLGEVVTALLERGLALRALEEHDGLEWRMFPHMTLEDGQYRLPPEQRAMVPMMYTLIAEKPG